MICRLTREPIVGNNCSAGEGGEVNEVPRPRSLSSGGEDRTSSGEILISYEMEKRPGKGGEGGLNSNGAGKEG